MQALMKGIDADSDNLMSLDEMRNAMTVLRKHDLDHDETISMAELGAPDQNFQRVVAVPARSASDPLAQCVSSCPSSRRERGARPSFAYSRPMMEPRANPRTNGSAPRRSVCLQRVLPGTISTATAPSTAKSCWRWCKSRLRTSSPSCALAIARRDWPPSS